MLLGSKAWSQGKAATGEADTTEAQGTPSSQTLMAVCTPQASLRPSDSASGIFPPDPDSTNKELFGCSSLIIRLDLVS